MRAQPERDDLRADDQQQRAADQRVDVPLAAEHVDARQDQQRDERAEQRHHGARQDEQVVGRVHEQEAQVPPAVAEARQLRLAAARVVLDRELADVEVLLRRPDHHLGGELHPRRAQLQLRERVGAQRAHAAVGVADAGSEQQVEEPGQQRVAHIPVEPRHRARVDVLHAVADHHVGAVLQLGEESRDLVEVVREVGVAHHDELAARGGEAGEVGAAVAAPRLVHDARAGRLGQLAAAVVRVVVGDDDLAGDRVARQRLARPRDAFDDVLRLVEAGDHDGHQRAVRDRS